MIDMRKILGTLIGILGFIAAMAGLTYAMLTASVTNTNTITGYQCVNIQYSKGTDVTANELNFQESHNNSAIQTQITFYQNANTSQDCGNNIGTIYINTSTNSSDSLINSGVLKYTIEKKSQTGTLLNTYEGYITQKGDTAVEIGKLENSPTTYTIYLWLENDSTGSVTNETISEAVYSGYVHATARQSSTYTS